MRLETGLYAARESLMAHGTALNTIGDDLANSNTPGYKESRVEFSDIFASGPSHEFGGPIQTGSGTKVDSVFVNHRQQGTMEVTGRNLDVGILGNGWFTLQDAENKRLYSRAGNFSTDVDGNLIASSGAQVLGFTADSPDTEVPININNLVGSAIATTRTAISGTLDPVSTLVAAVPAGNTFKELSATASYATTLRATDSLGNERDISLYFYRTDVLTWEVRAFADGGQTGGVAGIPVQVGAGQIVTGPDGKQAEGAGLVLNLTPAWGDGAAPGNINLDLTKITSTAGVSNIFALNRDGLQGGVVSSVGFSEEGVLIAILATGEELVVADLAITDFASPDGLERLGNNMFGETTDSGEAIVAKAGTEGAGEVRGSALEASTVDPANEFVKMIQMQQGYRAGSQVIQTVNDLLSATIQIA